jgi:hypothetical protein
MEDFSRHVAAWNAARQAAIDMPTSAKRDERNRVREITEKATREFINRFLRYPPVTDDDRNQMGIRNRTTKRSRVSDPVTRPFLNNLRALGGYAVGFHFHDENVEHSRSIPRGCNGCLVNFHCGPEKVTDLSLLKDSKLFTSSPARMQLQPSTEGQWLSMSPRWQLNKDGILGPPGPIEYIRVI